jgi:hypothetical protein
MFGVVHDFEGTTFERLGLTEDEAHARADELRAEGIVPEIIEYGPRIRHGVHQSLPRGES